ncbi:MAG: ABC transporter permease [Beduini sp.]|uniref:ABC transporter permease n=1 Tax=Beduini sp. TaxID=1922300 RepID=UPI00399F806F
MKENQNRLRKHCLLVLMVYILFIVSFFATGQKQLKYDQGSVINTGIKNESYLEELENGQKVVQESIVGGKYIDYFEITFGTFDRTDLVGKLDIQLVKKDSNEILYETSLEMKDIKNAVPMRFAVDKELEVQNGIVSLVIMAEDTLPGKSVTVMTQNANVNDGDNLYINEGIISNTGLCANISYLNSAVYYPVLLPLGIFSIIALAIYLYCLQDANLKGKKCIGLGFIQKMYKYQFLLEQLVQRDFKTKYKRSVLGVLWSVLNPLLTMAVQYAVFSQLFRYQIANYPVYLLTGTVIFNCFTDATNQGIYSIINNASLITKVYVPKNIYPISKVLSSFVNLLFSFIPLLLLAWFTGLLPSASYLMIPYGILCLIIGAIGLAYILSALMVFFRDVQFLWSLFTLMWMYATPIFYPIDILPNFMRILMKFNPMYYFVEFFRTILIDRITPEPLSFVVMAVSAVFFLIIGNAVFKKLENKFALYI